MSPKHPYRARGLFYVVSLLVFALIATLTILYAIGYHVDFTSGRVTKTGLLVVSSLPRGAYVTINGTLNPKRTAARIKLERGTYDVKVDQPDVIPWDKQIEIEPGQAALEDNILLFAKNPKPRVLAAGGVGGLALSGNGRTVAFLKADPDGTKLSQASAAGSGAPEAVATLPNQFGTPASFAFSSDGNRVLASTADQTIVTGAGLGTPAKLPVGGAVRFAPGDRDRILFGQDGTINSLNVTDQRRQLLENRVVAWTVSRDALYASKSDGSLVRIDLRSNARRQVSAPAILTDLTASPDGDVLYGRTADGTLFTLDNDKLDQVATGVELVTPDPTGQIIAFSSRHELTVWKRSDRQATLVTRSSQPYQTVAVVTDGHYLLYQQNGQLHAIAIDGSNDVILANLKVPASLAAETTLVGISDAGELFSEALLAK